MLCSLLTSSFLELLLSRKSKFSQDTFADMCTYELMTAFIPLLCSATLLPSIKRFLPKEWNDNLIVWRAPLIHSLSVEFTKSQIVASVPGFFFCMWYASKKHWLANNVLGIAFCIQGIEMLSLGSFKTGAILLVSSFSPSLYWFEHIFLFWGITSNDTSLSFQS
jgi:hypothetical protein